DHLAAPRRPRSRFKRPIHTLRPIVGSRSAGREVERVVANGALIMLAATTSTTVAYPTKAGTARANTESAPVKNRARDTTQSAPTTMVKRGSHDGQASTLRATAPRASTAAAAGRASTAPTIWKNAWKAVTGPE